MNVTKHFKLSEFLCKCGKDSCKFIEPTALQMQAIEKVSNALEVVRIIADNPIIITSGLRCPSHNKAVGGNDRSQHLLGTAVDIKCYGVGQGNLYDIIERLAEDDHIDDVPNGGLSKNYPSSIVHYDVRNTKARW